MNRLPSPYSRYCLSLMNGLAAVAVEDADGDDRAEAVQRMELVEFDVVAGDEQHPEDGADERRDLGHEHAPPQRPHPQRPTYWAATAQHPTNAFAAMRNQPKSRWASNSALASDRPIGVRSPDACHSLQPMPPRITVTVESSSTPVTKPRRLSLT